MVIYYTLTSLTEKTSLQLILIQETEKPKCPSAEKLIHTVQYINPKHFPSATQHYTKLRNQSRLVVSGVNWDSAHRHDFFGGDGNIPELSSGDNYTT
jgi:hypothetical protein